MMAYNRCICVHRSDRSVGVIVYSVPTDQVFTSNSPPIHLVFVSCVPPIPPPPPHHPLHLVLTYSPPVHHPLTCDSPPISLPITSLSPIGLLCASHSRAILIVFISYPPSNRLLCAPCPTHYAPHVHRHGSLYVILDYKHLSAPDCFVTR
jgi:hypothetical protein